MNVWYIKTIALSPRNLESHYLAFYRIGVMAHRNCMNLLKNCICAVLNETHVCLALSELALKFQCCISNGSRSRAEKRWVSFSKRVKYRFYNEIDERHKLDL